MLYLINSINWSGERVDRHKNGRAYNRFHLRLKDGAIVVSHGVCATFGLCITTGRLSRLFSLSLYASLGAELGPLSHAYPLSAPSGAQLTDIVMVVRPLVWPCCPDVLG
jgi:hypothetical protein